LKFKHFFNPFAYGKTKGERFTFLFYVAPLFYTLIGPYWFILGLPFPILMEIIRRGEKKYCAINIACVQTVLSDPYTHFFFKLQEKLSEIPINVYVKKTSKTLSKKKNRKSKRRAFAISRSL
jgi:hypothetical protein